MLLWIIFLSAATVFIYYSNDHVECDTLTEITLGESGEKMTTTRHVCKERFSF